MGEKDETEVDCVCGVPDSGVGMALGYAEGKGVPYKRAVLKYTPTWPRSFTPGNQERRSLVAKMKLIPNPALLKDQRVVFCDDSIVRGTQLKDNVKTFFEYGAKEVHCTRLSTTATPTMALTGATSTCLWTRLSSWPSPHSKMDARCTALTM